MWRTQEHCQNPEPLPDASLFCIYFGLIMSQFIELNIYIFLLYVRVKIWLFGFIYFIYLLFWGGLGGAGVLFVLLTGPGSLKKDLISFCSPLLSPA